MNNNHHFRSLSAQPQHQGLQSPTRLQINGNTTTMQQQLPVGSSVIKVYSDSQQSLDRLFNPQIAATSVPLRNRNLPQSFFEPNSQSATRNTNELPKANLHVRSASSIDHGYSNGNTHNHHLNNHVRTHSTLAPMMDLLEIDSNGGSTNILNQVGTQTRPYSSSSTNQQQPQISSLDGPTEQLMSTWPEDQESLVAPPVPFPRTFNSNIGQQSRPNIITANQSSVYQADQEIVSGQGRYHGRSFSLDQRSTNATSMQTSGSQYGLGGTVINSSAVSSGTHLRTHSTLDPMAEVTNDNTMTNTYSTSHCPTSTMGQTIFGDGCNTANGNIVNNIQPSTMIKSEPIANGSTNSSNSNVSYCYSYSSGFGSDELPVMPQEQLYNTEVRVDLEQSPMQPQPGLGYFPGPSHMQQGSYQH